MKNALLSGCALIALPAAQPVLAQAAVASPAPDDMPSTGAPTDSTGVPNVTQIGGKGGLTDIVVTAQRKTESAQRAGIAISAVSGNDVARQGVTQPD